MRLVDLTGVMTAFEKETVACIVRVFIVIGKNIIQKIFYHNDVAASCLIKVFLIISCH